MFTDISGYTSMVQRDESDALDKVNIHREVLASASGRYSGTLVSFYGDGSLSTFTSAIDAVNCAIQMQTEYIKRNVPVRVGIHLGDIVFRQDSVFGDGVNLAARIQAQGIPGSILISERLQAEIANHKHIATKNIGTYRLKNVKRPVNIFAVTSNGLRIPKRKRELSGIILAGVGLVVMGYFISVNLLFNPHEASFEEVREQRVAVRFQDYAKLTDRAELSDMAAHWITNRLGEIPDAEVVNYSEALNEPNISIAVASNQERSEFAQRTRAVNVLEGTIYRHGDQLLFEALFVNLATGETIERFDVVKCSVNDPMTGINTLSNQVRGWWASKGDNVYSTPNYESYQLFLKARDYWSEDRERAKDLLIRSIKTDSSFVDPYFLLTEFYDNIATDNSDSLSFVKRDSMIDEISNRFGDLSPRFRAMLDVYRANEQGDLLQTYRRYQVELESDPYDLFVNTGGMVHALEFVNRPEECIELFRIIPISSLDISECVYCQTRLRLATRAFLSLNQQDSAMHYARMLPLTSLRNLRYRLTPFVQNPDVDSIDNIIKLTSVGDMKSEVEEIYPALAWDFAVQGNNSFVEKYSNEGMRQSSDTPMRIECNYLLGNYEEVRRIIERAWPLEQFNHYEYILQYYARVYAHLDNDDDKQQVRSIITRLDDNDPYDYGKYAYILGVMEAIEGNNNQALVHLNEAYLKGFRFTRVTYSNDPDLTSLKDSRGFNALMSPLESY